MYSRADALQSAASAALAKGAVSNNSTPTTERPATLVSSHSMHALQLPKSNSCQNSLNTLPSKDSYESFTSSLNSSSSPCFPFGIEFMEKNPENHNCLQVLQTFVQYQQQQISLLESNLRELAFNSSRREENLLGQLCSLQKSSILHRYTQQCSITTERRDDIPNVTGVALCSKSFSEITAQVNGQDVSRSSHEDAVRAFQSADEPIVVEVLRRAQQTSASPVFVPPPPICCPGIKGNSIGGGSGASSPELVSTAVQTDWMGAWDLAASQEAFHTPPPHMYVIPEAEPDESYEDDYLGQEIMDYEEVTLQKSAARGERLGLTLCYSSVPGEVDDDAPDTEVFISAVEEAGVAGRDGRLREGDQILQVNGIDVTTKEQAEALFAASNDAVTLLVTRPSSRQDFDEELEDNDCGCESTSFIQIPAAEFDDEGAACSSGAAAVSESASNPSHQDSGLGTDLGAECSHEDHRDFENEIDLAQTPTQSTEERKHKLRKSKEPNTPAAGSTTQVVAEPGYLGSAETSPEDKRDCKENPTAENRIKSSMKAAMTMIPAQRLDLIDHELYQLNKKMEIIQLECESIAAQHNPSPLGSTVVRPFGDPETEHIYETIPEQTESEAEPIYSLPYEPERVQTMQPVSKVKNRTLRTCDPILKASKQEDVEQWVKLTGTDSKSSKDGESWLKKETWPHSVDSRSSSESRRRQNVDTARSKSKNKCKDSSSGDDKEKDSSSAYNTGESCRSTPLTLELGMSGDPTCGRSESTLVLCPPPPSASTEDRSMQVNLDSDTYSVISCESCRRCMRLPPLSPEQTASPSASPKKTVREPSAQKQNEPEKNLNYVTMIPADTMYTNAANLQQTIWLQQQLFRQALVKQSHNRLSPSSTISPKSPNPPAPEQTRRTMPACSPASSYMAPNLNGYQFVSGYGVVNGQPTSCTLPSPQSSSHAGRSAQHQQEPTTDAMQMEWKVKKRPDGSRYIARRPVRNRLLRDRAMKITEERAGVTTDDDAVSELKVGRYWTREERRKHVEKAKEKRKRQEAVIRGKMYPNKDVQEHGQLVKGEERASLSKKKQINIVELSHKKMARKKSANKDGFDDFTTVQEMLVHGNRVAPPVGPGGKMMGLLSVTTV